MDRQLRCKWSSEETETLLSLIEEFNMIPALFFHRCDRDTYTRLSVELGARFGIYRTKDQVRIRWKHIKHEYLMTKKTNDRNHLSKSVEPIFEKLDTLVEEARRILMTHHSHVAIVEDSMMGPPVPILELEHIKEEPPDLPSTSSSASPPRRFFRNTPREQEQPPWPRRQVPQQMPGVSGGSGGGGSMGAGGSQGPKQPSAQHISSMMKKHMSPGTPQQHSANKGAGPPRRVVSPPPSQSSHVGPPEVCLRWNSYHSNMQATFPSLLTNEQFVDVTLACEGRSIKCHKVILSACSAYFEGLLGENPCQHPIVLMKDLRYWEVQALVDFMYRGEVNVAQDKLPSLLAAAEALQIKGLAGPASTSSSQDEDSLPATLPSSLEEFLDDRAPSPITERRMRKRRMMNASELPHQLVRPQQMQHSQQQSQQQQLHHQQHQPQNRHQQMPPQPRPRPPLQAQQHPQMQRHMPSAAPSSSAAPVRVVRQQQQQHIPPRAPVTSVASTSSYRHEQAPEVPPPRKQRRSEPLPPVKIEPIDIDLSNDSMDEDFMEKKFTPPTESKDDGQPDSLLESVSEEQKPDIDSENFSETAVSSIRELQDFPFEPGSNSGGTKTESNAEATNDSPFDSSPGDDDGAGSHEEQAQD